MLAALSLVPVGKKLRVCVAGTGAGVLSMYLASHFGERASVTSIDVNEKIVNMGKKYFGLTNAVQSVIADAFEYINSTQEEFDLVLFDVCYEVDNNGISPPQKYLSKEFLTRLT
jgi:spermidine synthase